MDQTLKFCAALAFVIVGWVSLTPTSINVDPAAPLVGPVTRVAMLFFVSSLVFVAWREAIRIALPVMIVAAIIFEVGQLMHEKRNYAHDELIGNLVGVLLGLLFFRALRRFAYNIRS